VGGVGDGGVWVGELSRPDRYRLVRMLGGGAEGEVWQAEEPLDDGTVRPVAVKIVTVRDADAWTAQGELLTSLLAPGLVRVREMFVGPAKHPAGNAADGPGAAAHGYCVMDFVAGVSLPQWIEENPTAGMSSRLQLLLTAASALDDLHDASGWMIGMVHGDVKPGNLVVDGRGSAVIVDLGLAQPADAARPLGLTYPYAAPELVGTAAAPTPASDRFSFAATVAHLLTGQTPARRGDRLDRDGVRAQLDDVAALAGREDLKVALLAALGDDPAERPVALRPWLSALLHSTSTVTRSAATQVPPSPRDDVPPAPATPALTPLTPAGPRGPVPAPSPARPAPSRTVVVAAALTVAVVTGTVALVALARTSSDPAPRRSEAVGLTASAHPAARGPSAGPSPGSSSGSVWTDVATDQPGEPAPTGTIPAGTAPTGTAPDPAGTTTGGPAAEGAPPAPAPAPATTRAETRAPAPTPLSSLTVVVNGSGSVAGTVACTTSCTVERPRGTSVQLRASAAAGNRFVSWVSCPSPQGPVCTLTLPAGALTVVADLAPAPVPGPVSIVLVNHARGTVWEAQWKPVSQATGYRAVWTDTGSGRTLSSVNAVAGQTQYGAGFSLLAGTHTYRVVVTSFNGNGQSEARKEMTTTCTTNAYATCAT